MTLYRRINPSRSNGAELLKEAQRDFPKDKVLPARRAERTGLVETNPAEKTKDPTPISISDVPQVSTFAKRLGKTRKSTARIATHVETIIVPLYAVTKGRTGSGSRFSWLSESFLGVLVGGGFRGFFCWLFAGGRAHRRTAGETSRALSSRMFDEYSVVANKKAATFSKKSARNAGKLYLRKKFCRDWRADQSRYAA